jgi:hypothetical protein
MREKENKNFSNLTIAQLIKLYNQINERLILIIMNILKSKKVQQYCKAYTVKLYNVFN